MFGAKRRLADSFGHEASEAAEDENGRPKRIVADLTPDRGMLQEAVRRKLRGLPGVAGSRALCGPTRQGGVRHRANLHRRDRTLTKWTAKGMVPQNEENGR